MNEKKNNVFQASALTIRRRVFWYSSLSMLLFCIVLLSVVSLPIYEKMKDAENRLVNEASLLRSLALKEWYRRAVGLSLQITSRTRIREELERYVHSKIDLRSVREFTEPKIQDAMMLSDEIVGVTRIDRKGTPVARCGMIVPRGAMTIDYTGRFEVALSKAFVMGGRTVAVVSAPIVSASGEYLGADLVLFDLGKVRAIIDNRSGLGEKSAIVLGCIFDGEASIVFKSGPLDLEKEFQTSYADYVERSIRREVGIDESSADYVVAYHELGDLHWGIVVVQDKKELYSGLYTRLGRIFVLSAIIYVVCVFGLWLILKPLSNRLLLREEELRSEIDRKTVNLQKALEDVKILSGLVPICSNCKKIRDDEGYWNGIEEYLQKHSEIAFSHGLCPECSEELYGEQEWYRKMKAKEGQGK